VSFRSIVNQSDIAFESNQFTANNASLGGGTFLDLEGPVNHSNATFRENIFASNYASYFGAGIYLAFHSTNFSGPVLRANNFTMNIAALYGGGVYFYHRNSLNTALLISSNTFTTNSALIGAGLSLFAEYFANSSVALVANAFTANNASDLGGGVCVFLEDIENCLVTVQSNAFLANSASIAGGAYLEFDGTQRSCNVTLQSNNLQFNRAQELGGALCIRETGFVLHRQLCFLGDQYASNTGGTGGAVALVLSPAIPTGLGKPLDSPHFREWNYHWNSVSFDNVNFTGNAADCMTCSGGAIFLVNGRSLIQNCAFRGNSAGLSGGALFLDGDSTALTLANCLFVDNSASISGAQLSSMSGGNNSISNCTFQSAQVTLSGERIFEIPQGGLVSLSPENTLTCPRGAVFLNQTENTRTSFSSPWLHPILLSAVIFTCLPCPRGHYTLDYGSMTNETTNNASCYDCPRGAICLGGEQVEALLGYWCGLVDPAAESTTILECAPCPEGYCSEGEQRPWNESCIDTRTGVLCGRCVEGRSEALLTEECIDTARCNDAFWAVPVAFLIGLGYAAFVAYVPVRDHPLWKSITYFMQVAPLFVASYAGSEAASEWSRSAQFLFGLFELEPSIIGLTSVYVCLWPGMNAVQEILTSYGVAAIPLLGLAMLVAIHWLWRKLRALYSRLLQAQPEGEESNAEDQEEKPLLGLAEDEKAHKPAHHSPYAIYAGTLVALILLLYEGVTSTTASLLQCTVRLGGTWRLFTAGYIECPQPWQWLLGLTLGSVLLTFPVLLLYVRSKAHRAKHSAAAHSVLEALEGSYTPDCNWWESVSMLRRLVLVLLTTFVPDDQWRALSLFVVCLVVLLSHLYFKPFPGKQAHRVETAFLCDLVILSALQVDHSVYEYLGFSVEQRRGVALAILQGLLVLLPLIYCFLVVIWTKGPKVVRWLREKGGGN
jgi:hypothetical protein